VARPVNALLFLCLFAAQSGVIALSPVLVEVADEFGVSAAAAGQLRTIAGLAAAFTALALPAAGRRLSLRRLLRSGAIVLALASLASAGAPSFALLAFAQVPVGVAVATVTASAMTAAAEWPPVDARARTLAWALIGNPAAWILGMPLIGLLGGASWRLGWLALPLPAAVGAAIAVGRKTGRDAGAQRSVGLRAALAEPPVRRWTVSELAANSGWLGLLVYAGALFDESYDSSPKAVGAVLALAAVAFVAGNFAFRRAAEGDARRTLVALALGMAFLVVLLGTARHSPTVSAVVFASTSFLGGGRSLLGNAFALRLAPEQRVAAMAVRAAANQLGYFVGAAIGGAALGAAGYPGLGLVLAVLFVVGALVLVERVPTPPPHTRATLPARLRRAAVPARAR
jgi:predicted MFS family arabinose efflux permease